MTSNLEQEIEQFKKKLKTSKRQQTSRKGKA
jgi:hypothetical protein